MKELLSDHKALSFETPSLLIKTSEEKRAHIYEFLFKMLCLIATLLPLVLMALLLTDTFVRGFKRLNLDFITNLPSRFAHQAGILPGLVGTCYLLILTALIAIPVGIAAAIYLEEYADDSWLKKLIELNVTNLAGVPSVIFGLLGLELFVRFAGLGPSLLAGALTLSLLILPVIITTARESLKSVPNTLKEAGLALGANKLSVIFRVILPLAMAPIITGAILSLSRAMGESAPIIVIGAATYLAFVPEGVMGDFSALPLQIFHWVQRPQAAFIDNAAAAIIILLFILAIFNLIAALLRHHHEKMRGNS